MIDIRLLAVAVLGIGAGFAQDAREQTLESSPGVELEFIASEISRSGTSIFRLWRGLHLEGEYLGSADFDVGITGVSWKLRWKGLAVSPGLAVGFGSARRTRLLRRSMDARNAPLVQPGLLGAVFERARHRECGLRVAFRRSRLGSRQ
jgi:hypothetical protein